MTAEQPSYELLLQAVGRVLEGRRKLIKEICVLQAGDRFIVNVMEATSSLGGPAFAPATVVIEPEEIKAAIAAIQHSQAESERSQQPTGRRWFGLG